MNRVQGIFIKSRRLAMLRFLSEGAGYTLNLSILQSALSAIGLNSSRDAVEGEAAWLAEAGLLEYFALEGSGVMVARLTARGLDVALGHAEHPGVDRPRPDAEQGGV